MSEVISKTVVERIVNQYRKSITPETTQQEMLQVIGLIVYEAINSIDKKDASEDVFNSIANGMAKKGIILGS